MKYDVVVIGAGPAGLKAAEVLAKNNKKVLVLEKNKVIGPKCCAGGITNKDLVYIDKKLIEYSFNSLIFHSKLQSREIRLKDNSIFAINRETLGQYLAEKAKKAGAIIKTNVKIKKLDQNSIIADNKKIVFSNLIGADGSNSYVRKCLKLDNKNTMIAMHYIVKKEFNDMEFFLDYNNFGIGYAWIFPHNGSASIGCGSYDILGANLRRNFERWLLKKGISVKNSKFEAATINYNYINYRFGNFFLVGDAAGLASPLTGEGIYQALLSGEEVAKKILDKNYVCTRLNKLIEMNNRRRKRIEELLKKNKTYMKTNLEFGTFLLRFPYFQRKLLKRILR